MKNINDFKELPIKINMAIERQLRWNVFSEDDPPRHELYFLIIGDRRQITRIKQRSIREFQPTEGMHTITEGVIKGTKLRFDLSSFMSYRKDSLDEIKWRRIYKGTIAKDEELYARRSQKSYEDFVNKYLPRLVAQ